MRLINWIKQGFVSLVGSNAGADYPTATATYKGKATPFVEMTPYGLYHELPAGNGTHVLMFLAEGQESVKFGIGQRYADRPPLVPGEVAVGNTQTGALIIFKADGSITLDTPDDLVATVAGKTTLNSTGGVDIIGNVSITGTLAVSEAVTMSKTLVVTLDATIGGIGFLGHTHLYVAPEHALPTPAATAVPA